MHRSFALLSVGVLSLTACLSRMPGLVPAVGTAPGFRLEAHDGHVRQLSEPPGPTVVVFYRGHW